MKPCRECGPPYPARPKWDGYGFEYKSKATFFGWPLLHISFKFRPNRRPVPAKGIIAIGQFGVGVVTIAQFGIGFFGLGQFIIGAYVLAQFALAYACIAQIAIVIHTGTGQIVKRLAEIMN
jgi:hypothetical protein